MAITHNSFSSCNFNAFSWFITRCPYPHTIWQSPEVPRPRGVIDTHFIGMVPGMNDRWAAAIGVVYWELDGPSELAGAAYCPFVFQALFDLFDQGLSGGQVASIIRRRWAQSFKYTQSQAFHLCVCQQFPI